jgi:hypothetical protein
LSDSESEFQETLVKARAVMAAIAATATPVRLGADPQPESAPIV